MSAAKKIVFHDHAFAIARQAARSGDVSFPLATVGGVLVAAFMTGTLMLVAILLCAAAAQWAIVTLERQIPPSFVISHSLCRLCRIIAQCPGDYIAAIPTRESLI